MAVFTGLGSNTAPSFTFSSDTNTGIYSPGADQVAISTGGTQRINIQADGDISFDSGSMFYDATNNRLGIGTGAPAEKLEIQDGSISVGSSTNTSSTNFLIDGYGYIFSGTKYGKTSIRSTYSNINNTASLEFYVAPGGVATAEAVRITSDSYVRLASGSGGIQFNGDTAAANALDDYELGTWTPSFGAESGTVSVTYTDQSGWYCKIGNVVHGAFNIAWSAASGTGNILQIRGMPFGYSGVATYGPVSFIGAVSKCRGVTFLNWGGTTGVQAAVGVYSTSYMNLQFFSSGMTTSDQRGRFNGCIGASGQITAKFQFLVA